MGTTATPAATKRLMDLTGLALSGSQVDGLAALLEEHGGAVHAETFAPGLARLAERAARAVTTA